MNNPFHTRLIDLKVEISRIPQATVAALGQAFADNNPIADAIAQVTTSTQALAELRCAIEAVAKKACDLEGRVKTAESRLACLLVLVLLEDALAHWSDDYSDETKERTIEAWQSIAELLRAFIAEARLPTTEEQACQKAWHDLRQELPNLPHHTDRVAPLRAGIRKLRWALLSWS
jgi:hypothetical protein